MSIRTGTVGVGIIGAGVISTQYLTAMTTYPDLEVRFIADLDTERARLQAEAFGIAHHGTVDQLFADDGVEIVVNLTIPAVHAEVGLQAIAAGKHVWSEKPLALDLDSGRALLDAAAVAGLRVASAPDTFLGGGLQTAQRVIARGDIGEPLTALALFETRGPDRWHPNPDFLFAPGAGPLFDMAPYYLTALVQNLGPIQSATAAGSQPRAERTIGAGPREGETFPVEVNTHVASTITFASGVRAQAAWSWDSGLTRSLVEITGTEGTLSLPNPNHFIGDTTLSRRDGDEPVVIPAEGVEVGRGIGVLELARAIRGGATERASGELAFHILDGMTAIATAAETGVSTTTQSTIESPALLPDSWDPFASTLE